MKSEKWKAFLPGLVALLLFSAQEAYPANHISQEMTIAAVVQTHADLDVYFASDMLLVSTTPGSYGRTANGSHQLHTPPLPGDYIREMADIRGTVVNEQGEPLIGVTILVKGSERGTVTDLDGRFELEGVGAEDALYFSYIGYADQEIQVGVRSEIHVILLEDSHAMDEIVITALGIEREKRSLGYSVGEVDSEALNKVPQENALGGLNGKVAGLKIANSTNDINSEVRVYIRGNTS